MALGDYLVSYFNIKTASKRAFVESLEENYAADGNMSTETILWEFQRLVAIAEKLQLRRDARGEKAAQRTAAHQALMI